jgi:transcriptional regulator with XRE-family HTH domain
MSAVKVTSFADQLASAMDSARLSRAQLSARLGITTQQVEKWLSGRVVPSADRQREILAACRAPAPDIAALVSAFQQRMTAELETLAGDLESLIAEQRPNKVEALVVAAKSAASTDRPAGRAAARRPGVR